MGYAFVISPCLVCKRPFTFNPKKVPSWYNEEGTREPICEPCIKRINILRVEKGKDPFSIHPEAYTYCDEVELG